MAGYQEFKAGSVWFYYNPSATKELERTKELGLLTCRPVVVVQHAYYPEWTENITVCPLTSSDRRSGVHIDTTVLSSGGVIEGGTILPYLIYTIKSRYLHPVTVSGRQQFLSLLALSDEDTEKVMQGVAYHLGFSKEEPEYVKNWKALDEYGRNVMAKSVRIAVTDFETHTQLFQHINQVPNDSDYVENHVNTTMTRMNSDRTGFVETRPDLKPSATPIIFKRYYLGDEPDQLGLFQALEDFGCADQFFRVKPEVDCFYDGSEKLSGVHSCDAPEVLNPWEMKAFLELKGKEMLVMTGIKSTSTAYRTRRVIEAYLEDHPKAFSFGKHCYTQCTRRPNEIFISRTKTNMVRWKFILERTPEELNEILTCHSELEFQNRWPSKFKLKLSQTKDCIVMLHPELIPTLPESVLNGLNLPSTETEPAPETFYSEMMDKVDRCKHNPKLEYWKTLSPQELAEISSCSKRNTGQTCKKFRLSKTALKTVKAQANAALRDKNITEIRMEDIDQKAFIRIMDGNLKVDTTMLYIFCIANYGQIMEAFNIAGSSKCPSRQAIATVKAKVRSIICVKPL